MRRSTKKEGQGNPEITGAGTRRQINEGSQLYQIGFQVVTDNLAIVERISH